MELFVKIFKSFQFLNVFAKHSILIMLGRNMPLISLLKCNDKNNSGFVKLNQIMFRLIILSKLLLVSCFPIEQLLPNCYITP